MLGARSRCPEEVTADGNGRIDTHCHVIPPGYCDWLEAQPGYRGPRFDWSPESALGAFDSLDVETGILSLSTPGVWIDRHTCASEATAWARRVNEYCAELVRAQPDRFGFFATVPLPDVDAAVTEARYALETLHADGVVLMSNTDGVYPGAPHWDPLMDVLDAAETTLFVHPTSPPAPPLPGVPAALVDFPAETTRVAVNLCTHGCPRRYPNIAVLLSHAGGFLPYVASRITTLAPVVAPALAESLTQEALRSFWFDTALSGNPYALPSLLAFADPHRVTFGSDWPHAPLETARQFTDRLDLALPRAQSAAVARDNAETLFPRLTARKASTQ